MSSQADSDTMSMQEAEGALEDNEQMIIRDTENSSSEQDLFQKFASCFVGGNTTAYQVQAKLLAFVAVNSYAVYKNTAIAAPPGQHSVQGIKFKLKPKRLLSEMADDAVGLPPVLGAFLFMDEATDPVTHVPLRHIAEQVVKPMLEK